MARFFLSLYVFVAMTLIGLSALLERTLLSPADAYQPELNALIEALQVMQQRSDAIEDFLDDSGLSWKTMARNTMAWTEDETQALQQGKALVLYDENGTTQIYLAARQNARMIEISLTNETNRGIPFVLYSSIFYLLLGGLLLLWIWPVWRDLNRLKESIKASPEDQMTYPLVGKHSLIYPIALEIESLRQQILALLQHQRELTGAVAHELRTPLARLKFSLEMLPDGQKQLPLHQEMVQDINELESRVQEMLDFTSMESQQPELNISEIPANELCSSTFERVMAIHPDGPEIELVGQPLQLLADEHFLQRALENLLLNALRYCEKRIQVNVVEQGQWVVIQVDDDGPGVPEPIREQIFTAFFRPDASRSRHRGGAGLGLTIVKQIAHWHGGDCSVTDSPFGGARFILRLPRQVDVNC